MARQLNRLSARTVATVKKPGRHADGGGLYLVVDKSGAKRWVFLFRFGGPLKEMGLGGLTRVNLAEARRLAEWCRSTLAKGTNPIDARKAAGRVPTFGECADEFVANMAGKWRNPEHRRQWAMTLTRYTETIRSMPVNMIDTAEVLRVLKPIWEKIPETAARLRGRIERVLDAAQARGFRSGENPARWRGHLDTLLPPRQKLTRGHHAAMPYHELPAFVARLRARDGVSARALEFVILTAARSGEVLGAKWSEIDLESKVWTVPATRIKAGREHRVPLSPRALAIIEEMQPVRVSDYVFPGYKSQRPLGDMALHMVLERMEVPFTVHGFRSSFRDWCGEVTSFPREVAEAALAHVVGDETERAYRRGDALEKRRKLMEAWAAYCEPKGSKVITSKWPKVVPLFSLKTEARRRRPGRPKGTGKGNALELATAIENLTTAGRQTVAAACRNLSKSPKSPWRGERPRALQERYRRFLARKNNPSSPSIDPRLEWLDQTALQILGGETHEN